jgi:aryl-alcohol dehydrogenase-like predicted oxidoreductase
MPNNTESLRSLAGTVRGCSRWAWAAWELSYAYGPSDQVESVATIHRALDSGVTFLDTAPPAGSSSNTLEGRSAASRGSEEPVGLIGSVDGRTSRTCGARWHRPVKSSAVRGRDRVDHQPSQE